MMEHEEANLKKYVLIFSAYYVALMAFLSVLLHGFNIDLGSGANMAILIGAGYASAMKFVTDLKRAPTKKEKRFLSFGCTLASFLVSVLAMAIIMPLAFGSGAAAELGQMFSTLPAWAWFAIIVIVGALHYLVLVLIFGWGARKYAAKFVEA